MKNKKLGVEMRERMKRRDFLCVSRDFFQESTIMILQADYPLRLCEKEIRADDFS